MGIDPDNVDGHNLRARFVTDQYAKGTPEAVTMRRAGTRAVRSSASITARPTPSHATTPQPWGCKMHLMPRKGDIAHNGHSWPWSRSDLEVMSPR